MIDGRALAVLVPAAIDDPARPSGGNVYDRRVLGELGRLGWTVTEHAVGDAGGGTDATSRADATAALAAVPTGTVVLVDGLVAALHPAQLRAESRRLRLVALVHMFGDDDRERDALRAVAAVIATSAWTRDRLTEDYGLPFGTVAVARPGVEPAPLGPGSPTGHRLLCVGAVARHKGQDVLVAALAALGDTAAHCTCLGSTEREPAFVAAQRNRPGADRVEFVGAVPHAAVTAAFATSDLLVVPSRAEAYGMVVTEALAHGMPVAVADVGGLPEAMGEVDGRRPGFVVAPDDPSALADALRRWLGGPSLRADLRAVAARRRATLTGWPDTAARVAGVLDRVRRGHGASAGRRY